jgi:2-dehydro-3-deoxyphosphogluconate aldolase / (4S)-4-hydroxy-2-oxoglutarate aldolase
MSASTFFDRAFDQSPVMAILRGFDPRETVALCHRAWDAGIRVVEVPVQTRDAMPSLRAALDAGRDRAMPVGAGTVLYPEQVTELTGLGVAFAVSPGFDGEVSAACAAADLPHLPGVATASEISRALRAGSIWQKAFPARDLGPAWVSAQRAPFPAVRFVATGGVDAHNARTFLDAGCRVVAVGSALSDPHQLDLLAQLAPRAAS